jgi:hypothetical protein
LRLKNTLAIRRLVILSGAKDLALVAAVHPTAMAIGVNRLYLTHYSRDLGMTD